jgi:hypothetical protein
MRSALRTQLVDELWVVGELELLHPVRLKSQSPAMTPTLGHRLALQLSYPQVPSLPDRDSTARS